MMMQLGTEITARGTIGNWWHVNLVNWENRWRDIYITQPCLACNIEVAPAERPFYPASKLSDGREMVQCGSYHRDTTPSRHTGKGVWLYQTLSHVNLTASLASLIQSMAPIALVNYFLSYYSPSISVPALAAHNRQYAFYMRPTRLSQKPCCGLKWYPW